MERFQKIRNNRRKFDISSICRFCGLENDERYNIVQINEDGVDFALKVSSMLGIKVHGGDKMPQNVCFICMDKINDFYEFRLMALNTEKQTRDALGLPLIEEKKPQEEKPKPSIKEIIKTKPAFVKLIDLKHASKDNFLIQKALEKLNQKHQEQNIPSTSVVKRETTPSAAITQPPAKKTRKDISCTICVDTYFSYISDFQDHLMKDHLPLIAKYACGSCRETFDQLSDFKNHENMHTLKRLPFVCYFCKTRYTKLRDYQRHMTNYNCPRKKKLPVLVEDIKCFQCKRKYLTQNLFEWHGCFLKTRGACTKCGLSIQKKKALLKHYVLCKAKFVTPEAARDPNADNSIKAENISPSRGSVISISNISSVKSKGVRKKTVPQRGTTVFKAEKEVNLSQANTTITQQAEEEDDEYANYDEDITYDNFGSDEEEDETITNLEPVVQLQESQPRIIDIKAEKSNDFEAVREQTIETNNSSIDSQIIRNIKKEQANKQAVVSTNKQKNVPEIRIKPEKPTNEQPVVQVLNPIAATQKAKPPTTGSMTARKKVFKLPSELAMKIKKEKMHVDYGDNSQDEQRDEAEPDPEEEAQLNAQISPRKIKEEKFESNAIKVTSNPSKPHKQLINPLALAMMRAKKAKAQAKGTTNGGSLVISAVTSMSEVPTNGDSEKLPNDCPAEETAVTRQTPEKNVDENTQNDKENEISSTNNENNIADETNSVMVEIPAEFNKSTEEQHSPAHDKNELNNEEIPPAVIPESEQNSEKVKSLEADSKNAETEPAETDGKITDIESQAINANEADELDQLLQRYGGDIDDTNDLPDTDLQDLLKFD